MDQWGKISERFHEWTAPLRPSPEDVEMFRRSLNPNARTLLLGVTPELLSLARVAVDNNPKMIEVHHSHAVLGDWADLPFGPEFDAVIGDGSLNVFQGRVDHFFQQVKKTLKNRGRLTLRVFSSPEVKEDLNSVLEGREGMGFHAFKWRVAQALATPYVRVQDLYRVIKPVWDHPTLEVYKDSDLIYYFPKVSELPKWDHIQFATSYELAERCPVITWNL